MLHLFFIIFLIHFIISDKIVLESSERNIYLKTHVVRIHTRIKIKNEGNDPIDHFDFAIDKKKIPYLGQIQFALGGKTEHLEFQEPVLSQENEDAMIYSVSLSLSGKSSVNVDVMETLVNYLQPLPKEIKQNENQKVVFNERMYLFSPYAVNTQKVSLFLPVRTVESYTQDATAKLEKKVLSYGEFSSQPAFAEDKPLRVHYQYNEPYIYASSLLKEIEISHWGNLAIEEHYVVHHGGASLKGGFSRLDFQRMASPSHFRQLTAYLPLSARDVYFRDRIGNISTSDCRVSPDGKNLLVDFLPRFPLFGGWKTTFYIGYNLPLGDYLKRDGGLYQLNTTFSTPFQETPILDHTVKVIIPEGSSEERLEISIPIDEEYKENRKTYLDTFGRTVLVMKRKNVVPEENVYFQVYYNFGYTFFFHEPLLVIGGLFLVCLIFMIYVRMDFSISKDEEDLEENRIKALDDLKSRYIIMNYDREDVFDDMENGVSLVEDNYEEYQKLTRAVEDQLKEIEEEVEEKILKEISSLLSEDKKKNQKRSKEESIIRKIEEETVKRMEKLKVFHAEWKRYHDTDEKNDKKREEIFDRRERLEEDYHVVSDLIVDLLDELK